MDKQGIKICHNNIIDQRQITQNNDKHILYLNDILNSSFFPMNYTFRVLTQSERVYQVQSICPNKTNKKNFPCTVVYHINAF